MTPTLTTRTLASGRTVYVDQDGRVIDKPADVKPVRYECDGFCGGTGVFRYAGRVENGRYIGKEGPCFRCNGKGYMTEADRKRNYGYDNFHRKVYL